jgi:hypothetical protein
MHTAPAAAACGTSFLLTSLPALNSAISTPSNLRSSRPWNGKPAAATDQPNGAAAGRTGV